MPQKNPNKKQTILVTSFQMSCSPTPASITSSSLNNHRCVHNTFLFLFFPPRPSIFVQLPQLIKSPSIYLLCAQVLKSATTHESRPILFLPAVLIEGARCFLINYGGVEETSRLRTPPREPSPEQNARSGTLPGLNTRLEVTSGHHVTSCHVASRPDVLDFISVP